MDECYRAARTNARAGACVASYKARSSVRSARSHDATYNAPRVLLIVTGALAGPTNGTRAVRLNRDRRVKASTMNVRVVLVFGSVIAASCSSTENLDLGTIVFANVVSQRNSTTILAWLVEYFFSCNAQLFCITLITFISFLNIRVRHS